VPLPESSSVLLSAGRGAAEMAVMRERIITIENFMLAWTFFSFGFGFGCGQVLVLGEAEYLVSTGVSVWRGWRGGACLV